MFNRVVGRGFGCCWLSRLGVLADRARHLLGLENGIEIVRYFVNSVVPSGRSIHRRNSVYRFGGGRGGWFQCVFLGRGADGGTVPDADANPGTADESADGYAGSTGQGSDAHAGTTYSY